ncbi:aldehyde dehydrogenase family protein [Promicromonospora iranensis]|uniref:Acyl-CoA reductase-like NAD-dependent aldehyde dehydrogenase n=1 Tax=Promicromonospora iranensis TaxID=1105144 RepID=A0ABU2CSY0_9MICO|nr:aldehyde dehydrogenase family protein [Promicromonospora iranensis]MDR7384445.1 acyl-CoA reductase-like NAD-dependent aldehyde dehydrogenase [Promicromonospora iranensis]
MSVTDTRATTESELDRAVEELKVGAERWAQLPVADRGALFRRVHASIAGVAEEWATLAAEAKHVVPSAPYAGEEWMTGPYGALESAATYAQSYEALAAGGSPLDGLAVGTAPGGRVAVRVLPRTAKEWVLFNGFRAEVWMPPGVTERQVRAEAGLRAGKVGEYGGVGLVLGAGNISSIAPLDAFYELVAHNRASLVKLNPTFAALIEVYRKALAPLIEAGVVRVVNGDGAVGAYLTRHGGIDKVHITGSAVTHDAIVWGTGEEARRRRAANDPQLPVPITSELGGVAPMIVVPGRWSAADLRFQAEHLVSMRLHNAGHNCVAGQLVVLSADWDQKDAFLAELRRALAAMPARTPWYPGTDAKVARAERAHPDAEHVGGSILMEVAPGDPACTDEYFAPVLAWTQLPGAGADFLRGAVGLANDSLYGTLGANVVVRPQDRAALGAAFDAAIADLRYGNIAINAWTGVGFLLPGGTWGAFPGHTVADVGSGMDVVHNGHLLSGPERTVVTGPFRPFPRSVLHGELSLFPKPPWFSGSRSGTETGRQLTRYAAVPSWGRLIPVLLAAFRA